MKKTKSPCCCVPLGVHFASRSLARQMSPPPPLSQDQGSAILAWLPHKKTIWVSAWHMCIMSRARQRSVSACVRGVYVTNRAHVSPRRYVRHTCVRYVRPSEYRYRSIRLNGRPIESRPYESVRRLLRMPHPQCIVCIPFVAPQCDEYSSRGIPMTIFRARWKVTSWWNASIINTLFFISPELLPKTYAKSNSALLFCRPLIFYTTVNLLQIKYCKGEKSLSFLNKIVNYK